MSTIIHSIPFEAKKYAINAIESGLAKGVEKSGKKLSHAGLSVVLIGTGVFFTLWGIASAIDIIFVMHGLGYVLIGLPTLLIAAFVCK